MSSGPQNISSGSQMSSRPKPKPKVLKPIDCIATSPVKTSRSAHERLWPYFCLIGHSSRRALSRLALSGQELSGAKRWGPPPPPPPPAALGDAHGPRRVPAHPDEEPAVMAVVGRPPWLRGGHQLDQVLPERLDIELLELLGVVEIRAERVRQGRVHVKHTQVELVRPPILDRVRSALLRGRARDRWVLALADALGHAIPFAV